MGGSFKFPGLVPALVLWVSSVLLLGFLVGVLAPLDLAGSVLGCLLVGTSEVSLGNLLGPIVTQFDLLRVAVAIWAPDNFDSLHDPPKIVVVVYGHYDF